jgi:hypothetical protein
MSITDQSLKEAEKRFLFYIKSNNFPLKISSLEKKNLMNIPLSQHFIMYYVKLRTKLVSYYCSFN